MRDLPYIAKTHMTSATHWRNKVVTNKQQVTTLGSIHAVDCWLVTLAVVESDDT
jgi:hypothetical protein